MCGHCDYVTDFAGCFIEKHMTGGKSLPFFISHAHFLLKQFPDNFCRILHSEIIGLDTEIIIFHIAPVRFCKMLTVNRALVVHLFYFRSSLIDRNVVAFCDSGGFGCCICRDKYVVSTRTVF